MYRVRPESTYKTVDKAFVIQPQGAFAQERGAYGMKWAIVIKKDSSGRALPTMREVIEGIINFLID